MKAITRAVDEALDEWYAKGYNDGLEKAWEAVKRIVLIPKNGGLSANEFHELFGSQSGWYDIFQGYTVYDVIEMLDKYDERNEIHVGDEVKVISTDISGIVAEVTLDDCVSCICVDGSMFSARKEQIEKTGNHFAEVSKLLEKLRGEG